MIKFINLHVEEFRGIRKLDIPFNEKSYAIHGPNGSGKSGVVDALGFVLTGSIKRLSGTGTAGVTVSKHAPHVHKRDDPGAALVSLEFRDLKSGQVGTITRSVKSPGAPTLDPDTPELRAALESVAGHPELTLSRREIIQFILAEASKRASEVQALLQLDALDAQRRALKSAQTKVARDVTEADGAVRSAGESVGRNLDLGQLVPEEVLKVINTHRATLGLGQLTALSMATYFAEGIDQTNSEKPFDKATALKDVAALRDGLDENQELAERWTNLHETVAKLAEDPTVLESLNHRSLVEAGLKLLADDAACPLCDLVWETPEGLRAHLDEKIERSKEAASLQQAIRDSAALLSETLRGARAVAQPVIVLAENWGQPGARASLAGWSDALLKLQTQLTMEQGPLSLLETLEAGVLKPDALLPKQLDALNKTLEEKPDTSAREKAKAFLITGADRWASLRIARSQQERAKRAHGIANAVYTAYTTAADRSLTALYDEVQGRFSEFYRQINSEDESGFKAELEPSAGSLDLAVDFYGLGMFPPGAYHSEGHQDGMGVCLYLALVEKLLGDSFQFAILDDVVMSVDSNHRRHFCDLLRTEFADVQFVITTHDPIWAKQMVSSHLIGKRDQMRFQGWTVDSGPAFEQGADFWDKIEADLQEDDVNGAAHKLRRGLEAELPDLAEDLRARVSYRGDAKYELGELLSAVSGRFSEWLGRAAKSANSWNSQEQKTKIAAIKDAKSKVMLAQQEESWTINALVHYNEWAALSKQDFRPVVDAWRDLLDLFRCDNPQCESWIGVSGSVGHEDGLRCSCGSFNLNLVEKK